MGQKSAWASPKSGKVFGHPSGQGNSVLRVGFCARLYDRDQQTISLYGRRLRECVARQGWTAIVQARKAARVPTGIRLETECKLWSVKLLASRSWTERSTSALVFISSLRETC